MFILTYSAGMTACAAFPAGIPARSATLEYRASASRPEVGMLAHPGSFSSAELLAGLAFTPDLVEVGLQRYATHTLWGLPPGLRPPLRGDYVGRASCFLMSPSSSSWSPPPDLPQLPYGQSWPREVWLSKAPCPPAFCGREAGLRPHLKVFPRVGQALRLRKNFRRLPYQHAAGLG